MFGKSGDGERGRVASPGSGESVLQEGAAFRGDLEAAGNVRVDGELEGRVSTAGTLTIGTKGNVTADLDAKNIVVMGCVDGSVTALSRIELQKGARVTGDLCAPTVVIEEGVFFEGQCKMGTHSKDKEILAIETDTSERAQYVH